MLITTLGAFAAFSLMTIAVGTDYWLYSRGVCRTKSTNDNDTSRKNEEVMTHSGLWRTCCLEGIETQLFVASSGLPSSFGSELGWGEGRTAGTNVVAQSGEVVLLPWGKFGFA